MTTTPCTPQEQRAPILTIEEVHPAEYASYWGDGSNSDGCQFYNCGEQVRPGKVIANPDWTRDDWTAFVDIIRAQLEEVRRVVNTPRGPERTGWSTGDMDSLELLAEWAQARAQGPQWFSTECVRLTEAVAYSCSGSGSHDGNVADALDSEGVRWTGSADDIRRNLKEVGAWDADDLVDDKANKERCLWIACCSVSENPGDYAEWTPRKEG